MLRKILSFVGLGVSPVPSDAVRSALLREFLLTKWPILLFQHTGLEVLGMNSCWFYHNVVGLVGSDVEMDDYNTVRKPFYKVDGQWTVYTENLEHSSQNAYLQDKKTNKC